MKISSLNEGQTIAALATPEGTGALAVVRLSGPEAIGIAEELVTLTHFKSLSGLPSQRTAHGCFHNNGTRIDQVMVTIFRSPRSYTGEDMVEISCHGGPAILRQVLRFCLEGGARTAQPGEFGRRAFLNGKMDLAQAEAVADLIAAQTENTRAQALSQLEGGISREINALREILLGILSHLEVRIDHSDDPSSGVVMDAGQTSGELGRALNIMQGLIRSYSYGRLIQEGVRIALAGKPNSGKSSLLNRLLKNDRAIVTPHPGTTRDTIEERFDLLGLPAVIVDTAGIREKASDDAEKLGIERTLKAIERSDLVIVLLDQSSDLAPEDIGILERVRGKNFLIVLNKMDLPEKLDTRELKTHAPDVPTVSVSALENRGIEELVEAVYRSVLPSDQGHHDGENVIVTNLRHKNCLETAAESMSRALKICLDAGESYSEECLALELKEALDSLDELLGLSAETDLLDRIFSRFCIGK